MKKRVCVFVFCFVLATLFASAAPIIVSPAAMNGWAFVTETGGGTGQMVNGPSTPPLGTGSAQLTTTVNNDRQLLLNMDYNGTLLGSIMALSYDTYRSSGGSALAVSFQFDIDTDVTDNNTSWMGRLVYEPYYTQVVQDNTWQHWDTLNTGANWWFSNTPGNSACSIGSPCTWQQVLSAFPNAGVRGAIQFKAGSYWPDFVGNVDNFAIQLNNSRTATVYNFENSEIPEPSTWALILTGLALMSLRGKNLRNKFRLPSWKTITTTAAPAVLLASLAIPATATPINPFVQFQQGGGPVHTIPVSGAPGNWFINDVVVDGNLISGVFGNAGYYDWLISIAGTNQTTSTAQYFLWVTQYFDNPPDIEGYSASMAFTGTGFGNHAPAISGGSMATVGYPGATSLGGDISGLACSGPVGGSTSCNSAGSNSFPAMPITSATTQISYLLSRSTGGTLSAGVHFETTQAPIPEPGTYSLMAAGLIGLAFWRRKKSNV